MRIFILKICYTFFGGFFMLIDTHCHIFDEYYSNKKQIIDSFNGIMIVSGVDDKTNKEILKINSKKIFVTLGIHPESVDSYKKEDLEFIENNLSKNNVVGIGEIGLDYHYTKDNKDNQIELFKLQLDLARKNKKSVVIHVRDAIKDVIDILKDYKDIKKIIHCYSGSYESALELLKLNCYFGIGGVVTFKNSKQLQSVVKLLPLENLVLETDSPYLSPFRGQVNIPNNTLEVAKKIAELKEITIDEVVNVTMMNAKTVFDLRI